MQCKHLRYMLPYYKLQHEHGMQSGNMSKGMQDNEAMAKGIRIHGEARRKREAWPFATSPIAMHPHASSVPARLALQPRAAQQRELRRKSGRERGDTTAVLAPARFGHRQA